MFLKVLLFIGLYIFMGFLVCMEVSPRIRDCNLILSHRFNKIGWLLFIISVLLLSLVSLFLA